MRARRSVTWSGLPHTLFASRRSYSLRMRSTTVF